MRQSHEALDVRITSDTIRVIAVCGELSVSTERALMDAYVRACAPEGGSGSLGRTARSPTAIILDLREMERLTSSGIGLLVTLLMRMHQQGQHLLAYGLSEHDRQLFARTRLDEVIGIFDTEAEALAAV